MKTLSLTLLLAIVLFGCVTQTNKQQNGQKYCLQKLWSTESVLLIPESALYDQSKDIIYVSNINSGADVKDANGFISKIDKSGNIIQLHWIDGLDAPKGMGIFNDKLYVTDIDQLVVISISEGKILEKIQVEGASFLNDIAIDKKGVVYISDTQIHKIFAYKKGEISVWKEDGMTNPNGLYCEDKRLLLASTDFNEIDYNSQELKIINDSIHGGDGIAPMCDGFYFVSEWPGEVFLISPDKSITSLLNTISYGINAADIDYIQEDGILLVPTFFHNTVDAYKLVVTD